MKSALKLSSALVALSMFGAGSQAALAQDASASAESNNAGVPDIVVTATRRSESANRIPVAIQAIGGEKLGQLNVTNFEKLVEYLPNVRTASRGPGISSIYIRGLSTDTAGAQILGVAGVQPNVALYVNDAPASTPGRNLDIHATDIERMEVLAGPQGTLFGANAMGGAIRYITNKPDLREFHAGVTGTAATTKGGAPSFGVEGFVNLPIVQDKLGLRLAFYSDHQGGYIDNVVGTYQMPWNPGGPGVLPTGNPLLIEQAIKSCVGVSNCVATTTGTQNGTTLVPTSFRVPIRQSITNTAFIEDNYNDANYNGGRATLAYEINEDWSVELMSLYQELQTDGVFDYTPSVGDLKVQQYGPNTLKDTISLSTLTLKGRLGMLDLIYTSSYQDHHAQQQGAYAKYASIGLYLPYYNCDAGVYSQNAASGQTCYAPNNSYKINDTNRRWTQEFRITTPSDKRARATLGLFYDINRIYDITQWNYVLPAAGFTYNLAPNSAVNVLNVGVLPGAGFVNTILRRDRQFAIYGEASFDIVPEKLIVTGGARYYSLSAGMYGGSSTSFTGAHRDTCASVSTAPSGLTTCNYTPLGTPPTELGASAVLSTNLAGINPKSYSGVILKGNLTYRITPDSLLYFTYSEGFRPGGFNRKGANSWASIPAAAIAANRAYAPDKVTNYEVGAKLSLADRKLQVNVSGYIIDWSDIQMAVFDQNISNQTFVNNLGNGRIKGFEGDITARPTPELTLSAGFSYNDTEFRGCTTNAIATILCAQGVLVPAGSPLALSPKFQGNLRMRYEWETSGGAKPFVQVGFHHVGSTISSDISNTNILFRGGTAATINGVTINPGDPIQFQPASFTQPGYDTFEASLGVSKDNWSLTVYAENIGDKRPQLFTSANDGEVRITTSRPRTIGLRMSYKM